MPQAIDSDLRSGSIISSDLQITHYQPGSDKMFTVGEFSKICQISVKTLHYYDRISLLRPEKVDKFTGYRYYSQEQLNRMLLILRLKRYGFSLEEIAWLLDCTEPEVRLNKLRQQKQKLNRQMQDMRLVISELDAHLRSYERTGDIMEYQKNYKINIVETTPHAVMAHRQSMGVADFGQHFGGIYERIARLHLTPNGICGAIYHDQEFDPECSDIEIFVGVAEEEQADKMLPGQLCVMTVHKGVYSNLHEAYGAVEEWLANSDYQGCGAPYDIYTKNGFNNLPPEEWETEVYFPVKRK